jgi:preprotein translocase subunit YajC
MAQLIILAAMFALVWALLIRPQAKRRQQQASLLSSIEPGDEVLTVGGLYGIVHEIDEEDDLIVEIAEGIHVRIARRAVGGVVKPDPDAEEDGDDATANGEEIVDAEIDEAEVVNDEESVSGASSA